jgi:6-pyruvoyl-tetrahydropterin synthase related domain
LKSSDEVQVGFSAGDPANVWMPGEGVPLALFLWLVGAATAVILPTFFLGDSSGHDFEFHVASWMEVVRQWHQGIWFPRWAQLGNYGFGEPRFIFYPPLSWLLGAFLGCILPWRAVPDAFIWISLVLAGITMYRLAREWLPRNRAIAAAVLYAVNPYHLVIVYYRSDFAELLATAIFPLLILMAMQLRRGGWRRVGEFAAVFALVWLANAPAAVIGTYTVGLIFLVNFIRERDWGLIVRAASGVAIGFALAAFYILPAALERSWVQIDMALIKNLQPWSNFVFTSNEDPEFLVFNWKVSGAALLMIGIFAISAVVVSRRRKELGERFWVPLVLGVVAIGLMFPLSGAAWKWVPELEFVQFPWRWLLTLDIAAILFFVYACGALKRVWVIWAACGVLLAGMGAWMCTNNWWDDDDVASVQEGITSGTGFGGVDEYVPVGSEHDLIPHDMPILQTVDPDSGDGKPADANHFKVLQWAPEKREIRSDANEAETLWVKLYPYPAWHATLNGAPVTLGHADDFGEAAVEMPAGRDDLILKFTRTWDRIAGGWISGLAAAGLLLTRIFGGRGGAAS